MKQIIVLWALALGCLACQQESASPSADRAETQATIPNESVASPEETAETEPLSDAEGQKTLSSFNGELMVPPQQQASITLSMSGSIHEMALLPGRFVQKGERLVTLENPEFIDLQQTYLEATVQCEFLEQEYLRAQALASQEATSRKRLQQSKADFLSAQSRQQGAATRLQLLGVDASQLASQGIQPYLEVKAPISGYLTEVKVNLGKYVSAGETICEIINKQESWLQLTAYEKDLAGLETGTEIEFTVNGMGGRTFEATLLSIDQRVDETNRSIQLYARVKKGDPQFRPGMYVNAWLRKK
ncbi:MAG: efflux RND transporter periplasmic adaptor subunit [Parabacteroides sp.]